MTARFNYLTIVSEDNYALGRFYEGFFHMRPTGKRGALEPVSLGDGQIGLNIYPRLPGYRAQLDHFGIEVDDIDQVHARLRESYPAIAWLERPLSARNAPVSTHDPDGNIFGLFQRGRHGHADFYDPQDGARHRHIDHIALRVLHPDRVAAFYAEVFDMARIDGPGEGGNHYLSDGNITLVVIPWDLDDFQKTGISARGMDHIGFKVDSIAALKDDIARVAAQNYRFQPGTSILGRGNEGAGRLDMFRKTCPLGQYQLSDSDGLLLDVVE